MAFPACSVGGVSAVLFRGGLQVVMKSVGRLLRYHIGSIAFGALLVAIVQTVRVVFEYLTKKAEDAQTGEPSCCFKFCVCCIRCCLKCTCDMVPTKRFWSSDSDLVFGCAGGGVWGGGRGAPVLTVFLHPPGPPHTPTPTYPHALSSPPPSVVGVGVAALCDGAPLLLTFLGAGRPDCWMLHRVGLETCVKWINKNAYIEIAIW